MVRILISSFFFKDTLFLDGETVEEKTTYRFPIWRIKELLTGSKSDLTFINAGENLIRRLPAQNAVVMPRLVDQILDVRGEWEAVLERFHTTVRRNELRLIRKYGYKTEVSYKDADFEMFFQKMYLPSVKLRHGQQAHIMPYAKAYSRFQQGLLFLTTRENNFVSGGLCDIQMESGIVHFLLTGVMQADQQLIKEGAQSALYYAIAQWANIQGYKAVDFEATEPYLKKGILQHKRKWGMAARIPPNMRKRLWFKVHRPTPAVNQFLKDNPCIMINGRGELQGLFFADDPDQVSPETRAEWDKLCAMPGLNGFQVWAIEDFVQS